MAGGRRGIVHPRWAMPGSALWRHSSQGSEPVRGGSWQRALVQCRLVRPGDSERVSGHDGDPGRGPALPAPVLGKRVMPGIEPCISHGSSRRSRLQQSAEYRHQARDLWLRVRVVGGGECHWLPGQHQDSRVQGQVFLLPPAGIILCLGRPTTRHAGCKLGSLGVLVPGTWTKESSGWIPGLPGKPAPCHSPPFIWDPLCSNPRPALLGTSGPAGSSLPSSLEAEIFRSH